jgi:uncharacterized protein (TIGR03067 family)
VFKGDTVTSGVLCGTGEATDPIKTDPTKTPAEIDLFRSEAGKSVPEALGIYKIEGDTLTIALGLDKGPNDRPKDFTPSDNALVFVLKRK